MTLLEHSRRSFDELRLGDAVALGDRRFEVERIARGGMGVVLILKRSSAVKLNRIGDLRSRLVLKAVRPDARDETGVALFRRELTVWAGFRHPNIVGLVDIVDGGNAGWIAAMDWCIGSLRDLLNKRRKFSSKECTSILNQLVDGLFYAYNKDGVLHLDLKPENILYGASLNHSPSKGAVAANPLDNYRFMISDWGIASIKQPQLDAIAGRPPTDEAVGRTLNNLGTILYMAPERLKPGCSSSVSSDVFSLGMMLVELLTGRLPFRQGLHPVESLLTGQYLCDAIALLKAESVPRPVFEMTTSMLAYNPHERMKDYNALQLSLRRSNKWSQLPFGWLLN